MWGEIGVVEKTNGSPHDYRLSPSGTTDVDLV